VKSAARPAQKTKPFFLLAELDVDDPFAHGLSSVSSSVRPSHLAGSGRSGGDGLADGQGLADQDAAGENDWNPDDLVDDQIEVGGGDWLDAFSEPEEEVGSEFQPKEFEAVFSESEPVDVLQDAIESPAVLHEHLEGASSVAGSPEVARATIEDDGYVRCPVLPWSSTNPAGRFTSWPKDRPVALRSFSTHGSYHPKCSLAKTRKALSDADFL